MSKHGLSFFIDGAEVTVDEIAEFVAGHIFSAISEHQQELLAHDIAHGIITCVSRKVEMTKIANDRQSWVNRHPPNHAGYYFCHICGGWVHETQAELDEIEPRSFRRGEDPFRDDNRRMAHTWPVQGPDGKEICPGNRGKGSRQIPSVTMEIAPPDGEI